MEVNTGCFGNSKASSQQHSERISNSQTPVHLSFYAHASLRQSVWQDCIVLQCSTCTLLYPIVVTSPEDNMITEILAVRGNKTY